ncbi:MAG: A/G-specific adenine glycosylase, partial [Chloroflexota bacterium]|nr:A/G-specific adenine glycosylase [Chloroflexota bacterium]
MADAHDLHQRVGAWYRANARDFPWRRRRDPYAVVVSEFMLQQTQASRAAPAFEAFLRAFPTLQALADAEPGAVIRAWAGMGYNQRAVRLHRLAQTVAREHGGELPRSVDELRRLPGVGPYTAAAVACFAFGASVPVADTNVYRVLSRVLYGVDAPSRAVIDRRVAGLTPGADSPATPQEWHQGLMDLGASVCTAAKPRCMLCPLREVCEAADALQDGARPALAEASIPYAPKQGRYEGSTRYYRGKTVELLRALPPGEALPLAALRERLGDKALAIVGGLQRDGLA